MLYAAAADSNEHRARLATGTLCLRLRRSTALENMPIKFMSSSARISHYVAETNTEWPIDVRCSMAGRSFAFDRPTGEARMPQKSITAQLCDRRTGPRPLSKRSH